MYSVQVGLTKEAQHKSELGSVQMPLDTKQQTEPIDGPRRDTRRPQSGIRELLLLPVLMGGLSLLMWFSLPTRQEARDAHAQEIELRRDWYVAVAQDLPANGRATSSSCSLKLDPSPSRYRYDNLRTNTEIVHASDLEDIGIHTGLANDDVKFYLRGDLTLLIYWRDKPPSPSRSRMTRKTMAEAIGAPLANQYLVLYGVTDLGTIPAALRVDAFLYDRNGRRLCEFSFTERYNPRASASQGNRGADSSLWGRAKSRFLNELSTLTGGTFIDEDF